MSATLALAAVALAAVSGLPGLVLPRDHAAADRSAALLLAFAALFAVAATVAIVLGASEQTLALPWLVLGERVEVGLDGLSAFFLLPTLGIRASPASMRSPTGRPEPTCAVRGVCVWRSG